MCEVCNYVAEHGGEPGDRRLSAEYWRRWRGEIRGLVRAGGWQVMSVDGEWPELSYTVGLWSHGQPELCIYGLASEIAAPILNAVADSACATNSVLDGAEVELRGWQFRVFQVPNPGAVVRRANTFYRRPARASVPAVQLVYPDGRGVWPWEPDCHLFPGQQPMPGTAVA